MTDQERLQEIKDAHEQTMKKPFFTHTAHPNDVAWLIKQAERVQESDAKHTELNIYLQNRNFTEGLGMHVVDAAILCIKRLEERVQETEINTSSDLSRRISELLPISVEAASDFVEGVENGFLSRSADKAMAIMARERAVRDMHTINQRYKLALEFYADEDNYDMDISFLPALSVDCMVFDDNGNAARQALRGESE